MTVGRSAIPSYCARCGVRCPSWSVAKTHCPKPEGLTLKQTKTLDMLVTGARYQAIADVMGVAPSTIHGRVEDLCRKFGIPNCDRVKLALYWAESKSRK